jgi:hypothetical protein
MFFSSVSTESFPLKSFVIFFSHSVKDVSLEASQWNSFARVVPVRRGYVKTSLTPLEKELMQ